MTTDLRDISVLQHDPRAIRDGLRDDLRALAPPEGVPDYWDVVTRPSLLRRVAMLLAEHVHADIDRIVASPQDAALATAVALHTGVPFAIIASESSESESSESESWVHGELHASERVCWIEFQAGPAASAHLHAVRDRDVRIGARLSVFEAPDLSASTALFRSPELRNATEVHLS